MMGGNQVVRVDLRNWTTSRAVIGAGPRALALGPAGRYVFVTLNAEGRVARLDLRTGALDKVTTGSAPRSLAIPRTGARSTSSTTRAAR